MIPGELKALAARLLVRAKIRAYILARKRAFRDPLPASSRLDVASAEILGDIYKLRSLPVLAGFLAPAELLHLYGTSPIFTENLGAIIAGTEFAGRLLESVEAKGYSRDTCSFHRATLGAALAGLLPKFRLVVATSHLCDGQSKMLEELAGRTGAPYFLLDVPQEESDAAVGYLAAQLERLEEKLASITGKRAATGDWERVFGFSNETREMMVRLNELRRRRPSPLYGRSAFTMTFQANLLMGTEFLRDCYRDLLGELESLGETAGVGERFRIVWLLAYPYFRGNFVDYLENELGVHAVADEFSHVHWPPLDPRRPHRSLALKLLRNPGLGPVERRVGLVEKLVEEFGVDGVLHYSHWGCRQGCGGVRPIADALRRRGAPFLDLDGDCVDSRNYSEGQARTRLEGFVELMRKTRRDTVPAATGDGLFLGIDIGSLSAKAVVVDSKGEVVFQEVLLTGASSKRAAARLRELVYDDERFGGRIRRCIATGYGRAVVDFADGQVTEITCHARGMAHRIKGVRTIIDIGGQDTKAIAVEGGGRVRRFVMNDKCAAGTGRFLEMMARTLEIDIEDLGPLSLRAGRATPISSMCTVFAESEVVSLIAEGAPIEEIARGVCEAIASRTVALLERVGKESRIAMSGGVAKNVGVVGALERALGAKLELPPAPQTAGALGAALIARDG